MTVSKPLALATVEYSKSGSLTYSNKTMKEPRIIVVGASMGGLKCFPRLLVQLSPDWPVAVFIVQHMFSEHKSHLASLLRLQTQLQVKDATDGAPIEAGCVYIAPANQHLLVKKGHIKITDGPEENGSRPSINSLFRSAAVAYQQHTIGILLSGLLTDGTTGMQAIKECGGITVVQSPQEAPFPEMPQSAINRAPIDHVVPLDEMGELIESLLSHEPTAPASVPPHYLEHQVRIAETPLTETTPRERIHLDQPADGKDDDLQSSLWTALQFMQERINMLENMSESERVKGRDTTAQKFARKAQESKVHVKNIRTHLTDVAQAHADITNRAAS